MTNSKFLRVRCKCNNEQIIFNKATTRIKCLNCDNVLSKPTGGKAEILAEIIESYE